MSSSPHLSVPLHVANECAAHQMSRIIATVQSPVARSSCSGARREQPVARAILPAAAYAARKVKEQGAHDAEWGEGEEEEEGVADQQG